MLGRRIGRSILVLAFWLGVWGVLSLLANNPLLLPGPWTVLRRLGSLAVTVNFWRTVAASLGRILLGAALGVLAGVLLAAGTSRSRLLRLLLSPLLTAVRATPVASFILLVLIWVGRNVLPVVIVFLMVMPVVWANVSAGIETVSLPLLEMGRIYHFSPTRMVKRVYIPWVMPHFLAACQTGLGLGWKAGVAAEVLTVPVRSIGRMLYEAKLYLETVDLFAWTAAVVLCSLAIEKLLMAAVGRLGRRYERGKLAP